MNVIKITPRGYCHGVVGALQLVAQTLADDTAPKPIYLLGEIVHNANITKALNNRGLITLNGSTRAEMLAKVSSGTIIITAHGIDPHLIAQAEAKGLNIVDATCADVYKTHDVISQKIADGYDVIYIGKKGHPEPEGAVGINPTRIHLISNEDDLNQLHIDNLKLCITNQTTMSFWDTVKLMEAAKTRFKQLEIINEICSATSMRQEAVSEMASLADLTVVVGDPKSNNTNRLVQISNELANTPAIRIGTVSDLDINLLKNIDTIAVTSGASTPTLITKEVITFLEQFDPKDQQTWDNSSTIDMQRIIPRAKKKHTNT